LPAEIDFQSHGKIPGNETGEGKVANGVRRQRESFEKSMLSYEHNTTTTPTSSTPCDISIATPMP
jgi:hypothetical protein